MAAPTVLPGAALGPSILGQGRGAFGGRAGDDGRFLKIKLPSPGRCSGKATHTIMLFDNSGSVTGGNDPIGRRFEEAMVAVERVGRRCRCGKELVSVVHFDCPTSNDVHGARLDRRGRIDIERGLALPRDGAGSSEMGPALKRAYKLIRTHPNHTPILVAFTDFELLDRNVEATLTKYRTFPGIVHATVLNSSPPECLIEDDRVTVTQINNDSPTGSVAKAVFAALTSCRREVKS